MVNPSNHTVYSARLLGLWVWIPPGAWMSFQYERCVLSGRGLCDRPLSHPGSPSECGVITLCDLKPSRMRWLRPEWGCCTTRKILSVWLKTHIPNSLFVYPGFKLFSVGFVMHTTLYDHICCTFLSHTILVFSYILISTNILQLMVLTLSFSSICSINLFGLPCFVLVYLVHKYVSVAVCHKYLWKQLSWIYWKILPDMILGSERGHFWDTAYLEYSLALT
jgi:hypothetical protein